MQLNDQNKKDLVEIWNNAESKELAVNGVQNYFTNNFDHTPSRSTIYRVMHKLGANINKKSPPIKL